MGNTKGIKPLIIFHADCQDGFGAAFAAWLKLGDEAEYLPMDYSETSPDMMAEKCHDREVYILDFSFKRPVMEHIFDAAKQVVWLDHHKTAFEMWCPGETEYYCCAADPEIILDNNKSGALLAWEYFHPGTEVPMLIQHIDDRDRWQWKLKGTAEISAALWSMRPWSFEQWDELMHPDHYGSLWSEGAAILRAQKQQIAQMAKQGRKCRIIKAEPRQGGEHWESDILVDARGLAVNAPIHQSEIGHELANASSTYGLVWYLDADNVVRCSLRSNGDYDVSAIARTFGGGGHRNAAGFSTDIATLMGWLA